MDAIVVGIDVSKDRLDVAVRPAGEHFVVSRDPQGLRELNARLKPLAVTAIGLEATGGYEAIVAGSLTAAGLPVVVVNPAQVRDFAKALGKRAKTDPIDAGVIAHFVETTKPPIRPLPDADTQRLADLIARRGQIIDMMVAERQRRKRLTEKRIVKSIVRLLAALQKELSAVETDIDDAVRGSPAWREKEDLLVSAGGIGKTIARTLIAELPELGTLDRRRIAALSGIAPCPGAQGVVHRRDGGGSAQPGIEGVPRQAGRRWQTEAGGADRHRAQVADHAERDAARRQTLAGGLA